MRIHNPGDNPMFSLDVRGGPCGSDSVDVVGCPGGGEGCNGMWDVGGVSGGVVGWQ
jgi:hypothetical protein